MIEIKIYFFIRTLVKMKTVTSVLIGIIFTILVTRSEASSENLKEEEHGGHGNETEKIHLVSWNGEHVGIYLTITLFVVVSGYAKVIFHKLHWLSSRIPESW